MWYCSLSYSHRWAHLLKQQTLIIVILCQQRKTNVRIPFSVCIKQTVASFLIYLYIYWNWSIYRHRYIYLYICRHKFVSVWIYKYLYIFMLPFQTETEAQAIFLNLFAVCSSCRRKFAVCLFVYEETHGSYPFADGLNRLNRLNGLGWVIPSSFKDLLIITLFWHFCGVQSINCSRPQNSVALLLANHQIWENPECKI